MKCQHLNKDGKRCQRKAIHKEEYFGHPEHNYEKHYTTSWRLIFVCGNHLTTGEESESYVGRIEKKDLE